MKADRACTDPECRGIMTYDSGVTFTCQTCGRDWAPAWIVIDALDRLLCDLSLSDGPSVEAVIRIALNEYYPGDPDEQASLCDLPDMLNLPDLDANVFIAWAAWRRDRELVSEWVA